MTDTPPRKLRRAGVHGSITLTTAPGRRTFLVKCGYCGRLETHRVNHDRAIAVLEEHLVQAHGCGYGEELVVAFR